MCPSEATQLPLNRFRSGARVWMHFVTNDGNYQGNCARAVNPLKGP